MTGRDGTDNPDPADPCRGAHLAAAEIRRARLQRALALLGEAVIILDQEGLSKAAAYADMVQNFVAREV